MQTKMYKLEGLAQANAVLTSSNSEVMVKLSQLTVIMKYIQAPNGDVSSIVKNSTIRESKFHCWICVNNFTHGSKTYSSKKNSHKEEVYYKKDLE